MWFPPIAMAACFLLAGLIARCNPKALSGYELLPKRWKESTNPKALGHFTAWLLYLCTAVSLAALLLIRHKTAYAVVLCIPIPVLFTGWMWYLSKHKTRKQ